jgi:hypothetical protein
MTFDDADLLDIHAQDPVTAARSRAGSRGLV